MLSLIADAPIVSTDTLRPDHLCSALIAEADRLSVELERDLWQPAAAIAAHGMRGICLELPPRLNEISGEIVSELFDALNWAAPSGCYLGSSEGDGACFLWTLDISAQVDAINTDPSGRFEAVVLNVPEHWLSAIVNADESSFDYSGDEADYKAYQQFCECELSDGWQISSHAEEGEFMTYHDASPYGVLACQAVECLAMRPKQRNQTLRAWLDSMARWRDNERSSPLRPMKAPKLITRPVSPALIARCRAVRAFRFACDCAYRATRDDRYIAGRWVLPWYLEV